MWAQFEEDARRAVFFGQEEAVRIDGAFVDEHCLLLGCLVIQEAGGVLLLTSAGMDIEEIKAEATRRATASRKPKTPAEILLSPNAKRAIDGAYRARQVLGDTEIGVGHLLVGLASLRGSILEQRLVKRRERSSDLLIRLRVQNEILRAQAARYGGDRLSELFHSFRPLDLLTFSLIFEIRYGATADEVAKLDQMIDEIEKTGMNAKNTSTTLEFTESLSQAAELASQRGEPVHAAHLLAALYQRPGTTLSQIGPTFYPTHEAMLDHLVPKPA
ncbi:MAG: hypothetical protein ACO1SV_22930 [Fimbriimonas sp.]